ncbi:unnamed protein product, partial [Rotaria sp. Silwood1]
FLLMQLRFGARFEESDNRLFLIADPKILSAVNEYCTLTSI